MGMLLMSIPAPGICCVSVVERAKSDRRTPMNRVTRANAVIAFVLLDNDWLVQSERTKSQFFRSLPEGFGNSNGWISLYSSVFREDFAPAPSMNTCNSGFFFFALRKEKLLPCSRGGTDLLVHQSFWDSQAPSHTSAAGAILCSRSWIAVPSTLICFQVTSEHLIQQEPDKGRPGCCSQPAVCDVGQNRGGLLSPCSSERLEGDCRCHSFSSFCVNHNHNRGLGILVVALVALLLAFWRCK